jgi:cation:H+ antiporter
VSVADGLILLLGIVLAGVGGEVFVRGSVGLAATLRIPPGIIGATVAAFATSAPEMAVGVNAALAGTPQIAVGDALGSNVVNIGLVMGSVLLIAPIRLDRRDVRRDLPFTIAAPLILGLLLWDGWLSRTDGAVLALVFAVWMGTTVLQALRERDATSAVLGTRSPWRAATFTLAGVGLLILAGRLVVVAAGGIGHALGLDPFLVGATLVAFGTSVPELATALLARWRGHDDLGAGTVMGSNIFNSLWVVGIVALIRPFELHLEEVGVAVLAGSVAGLMMIPLSSWVLGRSRGAALVGGYAVYLAMLIRGGG